MFGRLGTAVRFLLIGIGIGLLTAPRTGAASRSLLTQRLPGAIGQRGPV